MTANVPLPTSISNLTASTVGLVGIGLAVSGELPTVAEFSKTIRWVAFVAGLCIVVLSFALTLQWAKVEASKLREPAQIVGGLTNGAALVLFVVFASGLFLTSLNEKSATEVYEDRLTAVEKKLTPNANTEAAKEVYDLLGQCYRIDGSSQLDVTVRLQCEKVLRSAGIVSRSDLESMLSELKALH